MILGNYRRSAAWLGDCPSIVGLSPRGRLKAVDLIAGRRLSYSLTK